MPCSECLRRAELLEQAEQRWKAKLQELRDVSRPERKRLMGPAIHAVKAARENVEHHRAVCTEEKQQ